MEHWAHAGKQLTARQRLLLQIVADAGPGGIAARSVAHRFWPRSQSWSKPTTRARGGVVFGQGAQMRVGVLLHDLEAAGLVATHGATRRLWAATAAGVEFLADALPFDQGQRTML